MADKAGKAVGHKSKRKPSSKNTGMNNYKH